MAPMRVLPLLLFLLLLSSPHVSSGQVYQAISGSLCIRPGFVRNESHSTSNIKCASLCSRDQRCQAFSLADGPCQLFVFDKCSKSVRDCSCSRRGQVFVKQQPGLEAGALCPSGYGDDLCGVKYKVMSTGNWSVQRQRCESESGLVIMADVTSSAEMVHLGPIISATPGAVSRWLGGLLAPGSGWHWVACNLPIDGSLWAIGEPHGGAEDAIIGIFRTRLGDARQSESHRAGLCECLSPFD